jgi:hypothetical protein
VDRLKIRETYAELLPYISTRDDLTYVLSEMIAELGASHCYVGGGDKPTEKYHGVGLPGTQKTGAGDLFVLWETGNIMRKSWKSSGTIKDSQIKKPHHIPVAICIMDINFAWHLFFIWHLFLSSYIYCRGIRERYFL